MDKEVFFATLGGKVFACLRKPFIICECSEALDCKTAESKLRRHFGGLSLAVYPFPIYDKMKPLERLTFERLVRERYYCFKDESIPDIGRVEKTASLEPNFEWLKAENISSGEMCLFKISIGLSMLVKKQADGELIFSGDGLSEAILREAKSCYENMS